MAKREEIRAMQDAWRAYLDLALGFTDASRKQATKVARRLVGKGGATADQLQGMAEDLVKTSLANRESLTRLVRFELDRALSRVGLATAEEVADLASRVRDLERRLRAAEAAAAAPAGGADGRPASAVAKGLVTPTPSASSAAASAAPSAAASATPSAPSEAAKAAPRKASGSAVAAKKTARAAGSGASAAGGAAIKKAPGAAAKAPGAVAKTATPAKKAVAKKAVAKKSPGTPPGGGMP